MATEKPPLTVFLCGPITNVTAGGAFNAAVRHFIESIAERLENAGFSVLSAHREELFGARVPERPIDVFLRDWRFAQIADAMVVVLPADSEGNLIRTDGTFMELGWAVALRKPLFIVTDLAATGRSYLFDGLLDVVAPNRFGLAEAMEGGELISRLQCELNCPATAEPASLATCPSYGGRPEESAVDGR
jgi:nucleoside 2-deoxyribosyltransferase